MLDYFAWSQSLPEPVDGQPILAASGPATVAPSATAAPVERHRPTARRRARPRRP